MCYRLDNNDDEWWWQAVGPDNACNSSMLHRLVPLIAFFLHLLFTGWMCFQAWRRRRWAVGLDDTTTASVCLFFLFFCCNKVNLRLVYLYGTETMTPLPPPIEVSTHASTRPWWWWWRLGIGRLEALWLETLKNGPSESPSHRPVFFKFHFSL